MRLDRLGPPLVRADLELGHERRNPQLPRGEALIGRPLMAHSAVKIASVRAATRGTAPEPAAASSATSPALAAPPGKGTWQGPGGTQAATAAQGSPGTTAQPATRAAEPNAPPTAAIYAEPASGASGAETSELWGIADEPARPDYQPQT
ncbi:hypothetical protein [Falsiroseomonas sp.]|uniref:hypothetical protein n=1 Tax=Falsiroseomonas sp. TaxID=2870721 RepID=UPI003561A3C4